MNTNQILGDKRHAVLRIAERHGARNVRVIGSVARGDARPDSDLDLLITLDEGRSLLDIVAIKQDLEDLLGRKVDVVTDRAISPSIRGWVLRDAVGL